MKKTHFTAGVRCALALLLALVAFPSFSEDTRARLSIKVDQLLSRDYPDIVAYAIVKNDTGETVQGLSPGFFKFRIDSMEFAQPRSCLFP